MWCTNGVFVYIHCILYVQMFEVSFDFGNQTCSPKVCEILKCKLWSIFNFFFSPLSPWWKASNLAVICTESSDSGRLRRWTNAQSSESTVPEWHIWFAMLWHSFGHHPFQKWLMYKWKMKVINQLTVLVAQCSTCTTEWDPLATCLWLGAERDKIRIPLKSIRALQLTWSEESFSHNVVGKDYVAKHRRNECKYKSP